MKQTTLKFFKLTLRHFSSAVIFAVVKLVMFAVVKLVFALRVTARLESECEYGMRLIFMMAKFLQNNIDKNMNGRFR